MLKKHYRLRIIFIMGLLLTAFVVIEARLYYIQVMNHEHYRDKAEQHQIKQILLTPTRGEIVDMDGSILATNLPRLSLYVFPKHMSETQKRAVEESAGRLVRKSSQQLAVMLRNDSPVAIGRMLDHATATLLQSTLADASLTRRQFWFTRENERVYPNGLAAAVIGYCASTPYGDNDGLAGLELQYNDNLKGKTDKWWTPRSATNYLLETVDNQTILDTYGDKLQLTLHAGLQDEIEKIVREQVNHYSADSGVCVVMDVKTGAVRAMANIPTFDSNAYERYPDSFRRNIAVTDPIEIGSVIKILTSCIVIDTGIVTPNTLIDCEGGYYRLRNGREIKDAPGHKLNVAPFHDVFAFSSNVGFVKVAMPVPKQVYWNYLDRFGLGSLTGIDLPEDGSGVLYPVSRWSDYSMSSLPMGYETSLTPIQTAAAVAAVANGGKRMSPYLVEKISRPTGEVVWTREPKVAAEVCSASTAAAVLAMMRQTIEHGTGERAKIPGYSMGGKTGTTRKSDVKDRAEYFSGFVGVLPLSDPQIVIYAYVNNPKGGKYGGDVAAPMVRKAALASVKYLHIPPDEGFEQIAEEHKPAQASTSASALHNMTPTNGDAKTAEVASEDMAAAAPDTAADATADPAGDGISAAEVAATPAQPAGPLMPDLRGMTMREALAVLKPLELEINTVGSGFVRDQTPAPATPVTPGAICALTFEMRSALNPAPLTAPGGDGEIN